MRVVTWGERVLSIGKGGGVVRGDSGVFIEGWSSLRKGGVVV